MAPTSIHRGSPTQRSTPLASSRAEADAAAEARDRARPPERASWRRPPNQPGVLLKDVMAHLGLASGSPSQRAATLLQAIGVDPHVPGGAELGSSAYLTAEGRRQLIAERDALLRPGG